MKQPAPAHPGLGSQTGYDKNLFLKTAVMLVTLTLAVFSQLGHAGGYSSIGVGLNYYTGQGHGYGNYGIRSFRGYPGFHGNGYKYGIYHNNGYNRIRHGYRYNRHYGYSGHNSKYYSTGDVAAALIVGGAIGYGIRYYQHRKYQNTTYVRTYSTGYSSPSSYDYSARYAGSYRPGLGTTRPAAMESGTATQNSGTPIRKLLKDLDGKCYEIRKNQLGDELRIQLQSWECNW